ncbi:MAG TPA: YCF48-related protein, partial [Pyrinomonadaceae bacterium]
MKTVKDCIAFRLLALSVFAVCLFANVATAFDSGEVNNEARAFKGGQIIGPNGGDVRAVAIDPRDKNRLYISTLDGQVHTSADAGKSWRFLVNLNRPLLILDNLTVDARDSNVIYTSGHRGTEPGGFFKTIDGGATWKEAKELRNEAIHAMVQSTTSPNILLVGGANGIWISNNSGDDWKKMESSTLPLNVDSLAIDPRDTNLIYAGTTWRAYKTTDGGKNWRLIKNGMIDDSDVFAIEIDQKNPDHVVASACSGIYESFNKGEKWTKIQGIPSQSRRTRDIKLNPANSGSYYAATTEGFWMSNAAGKAWMMTTSRELEINSIAVHAEEANRIFIATNNYGVMVSNDGGKNFEPTNGNFTSRFTLSVVPDIERPNRFYAATYNTATGGGFFFISDDAGLTWQPGMKNLIANRISPHTLLQDRIDPNTIYLGTNIGVFRSIDRGLSWTHLTPPKPKVIPKKRVPAKRKTAAKTKAKPAPVPPPAVVETPVETTGKVAALTEQINLLVHTEDGKNGIIAGTDSGLYRTYDINAGWEKIYFGENVTSKVFSIYTSPDHPGIIWVGTATSGLLLSRDDGETWQRVTGVPSDAPVSAIVVDRKRPERIYVGTTQTLYLSRDGGKTWMRRGGNLPLGNYTSILINPRNTDEIIVASALEANGGIYQSADAGASWKRVDTKEMNMASRRFWAMTFDPNDPNRILVGTHSSGIYRLERTPSAASNTTRPRVS